MDDRVCYDCGARYGRERARCDCGEPLWVDVDAAGVSPADLTDEPGLWRYAPLLPVGPTEGVARAAGDTPLLSAPSLESFVGVPVRVKDESANPTGSFKDRGSAVGVAAAVRDGAPVGTVSHGNMAMSVAAHAAAVGADCAVLVPDDIPTERLRFIAQYGPTLFRVRGDYGRLYERSLELGRERGVRFLNSDVPLRVEGQKTLAYELGEAFGGGPDAVVLPVSSGGNASAVWKGFRELAAVGVADVPRIHLVQAAACSPIADAVDRGDDRVTPVDARETVAYSIANADPPSGTRALAAARATGGRVLAVDDDAILAAKRAAARDAGLCVEAGSATALAGARELAAAGDVAADEDVVVVATGTGFREAATGRDAGEGETVAIDDLDERLDGFVDA
jgi:threonine synthase